jgi:hypothetical protein
MDKLRRTPTINYVYVFGVGVVALTSFCRAESASVPTSVERKPAIQTAKKGELDGPSTHTRPSTINMVTLGSLRITNLAQPGELEVENLGPDVDLAWTLLVQYEYNNQWINKVLDLGLELVQKCGEPKLGRCVRLIRGAKLRPVPWDGFTCASCSTGCRGNAYLDPGRFRFVISTCDGKKKIYGPSFDLPDYDHRNKAY